MPSSSQKFIARNRAPRVQIEYDVELYGSEKKTQLPFVMGVMSDLAGKSEEPQPAIADRKFLEIDVDNFDARMKAMRPRVAFTVPNTLTEEGNLAVDLTFQGMDDFTPAAIARGVESLRVLFEARTQLSNLLTYMDGKSSAEALIERVLQDPALLGAVAGSPVVGPARAPIEGEATEDNAVVRPMPVPGLSDVEAGPTDRASTPGALRQAVPTPAATYDTKTAALDALRMIVPEAAAIPDTAADALAALRNAAPVAAPEPDATDDALAALRDLAPAPTVADDANALALDALRMLVPEAAATPDTAADALAALRNAAPLAAPEPDATDDALAALRMVVRVAEVPPSEAAGALAVLRNTLPAADPEPDKTVSVLAALRDVVPSAMIADDDRLAALDALRMVVPDVVEATTAKDALADLRDAAVAVDPEPEPDAAVDAFGVLREAAVAPSSPLEPVRSALDGLRMAKLEMVEASDAAALALSAMRQVASVADASVADATVAFDALRMGTPEQPPPADPTADALSALLVGLPEPVVQPDAATLALDALRMVAVQAYHAPQDNPLAGLDDLLNPSPQNAADDPLSDLDALLPPAPQDDPLAGLDDLLRPPLPDTADDPLSDLDALLSPAPPDDPLAGLDDLLNPSSSEDDPLAGLEALLADPISAMDDTDPLAGLEALLAQTSPVVEDDDPLAGLEALLAAPVAAATAKEDALTNLDDILAAPKPKARLVSGFGRITAPAPSPERLHRPVFRIAILGDFTGRAARGEIAIGEAMARRRPILLDVDTVEDVIENLATTLVLPIGAEGRGIAVPLKGLDSLHPDELVENVEVFEALKGLRQRLSTPSMAAKAVAEMQGWGSAFGTIVQPTASRSAASAVPADLRLSDFQRLIGDREGKLSTPSPVADLIGQIVGPYVVPGPNPEARALRGAVDEAMSHAMRLILHHPEFQAIEAQWRSLDLLARRIETDEKLELVLFDISAEEIAADLTAGEDLSKSGLYRLVNAPLQDEGAIGFSAMFGFYAFEETPPHAALLGRVGAIAGHLQLPFFASMTANFLDSAKRDRHPMVAKAWNDLRRDPAAAWLGLAAPRFLLRRPYGASSEPVDTFDFEEFTMAEGLSGMLWANPVVLVAVLLAEAWNKGKGKIVLGKTMSMGDMPYYVVEDQHGDQVALPCTERNVTTEKTELAVTRGFMPVVSIRGRDVVRLASFQSLAGTEIAGPWLSEPPVRLPDEDGASFRATVPAAGDAAAQSMEDELDALLAGFGSSAAPVDPGAIDADLAALLEGL